jgi:hypothetical protein
VKKWLARQPRPRTVAALQAQLDTFTAYCNTARPHRALDRRTPAEAFAARPHAGPRRRGVLVDEHYRARRARIDSCGVVTIRHNSRLHHIGLGRRHAGTRVLLLIHERDIRVPAEDTGHLLRALTLDPAGVPSIHPKPVGPRSRSDLSTCCVLDWHNADQVPSTYRVQHAGRRNYELWVCIPIRG